MRSAQARRRTALVLGLGTTVLVATGCHVGPHAKAGAGESTDICTAIDSYNALPEPVLTDRAAVTGYVAGVQRALKRIDPKAHFAAIDGTKKSAPPQILTTLVAERAAYDAEAKVLAAAHTAAALHTAVQAFGTSTGLSSADTTLELWATSNCA
jgi:hypothetical protein